MPTQSPAPLRRDDAGATAIEYALLAGLIAVAIIGSAASLGRSVAGYYSATNDELVEHIQTSPIID
jgi:pilus assembly protein Flp/PilA